MRVGAALHRQRLASSQAAGLDASGSVGSNSEQLLVPARFQAGKSIYRILGFTKVHVVCAKVHAVCAKVRAVCAEVHARRWTLSQDSTGIDSVQNTQQGVLCCAVLC